MSDERKNVETDDGGAGIKVTDRRTFTSEGERRETREEPEERPGEEAGFSHEPVDEDLEVNFTTLISAMATPVLVHLGEVSHPDDGKATVNLEQARLQIDSLALLRVKCRGNLTSAEEILLERVLRDLRMLFVKKSGETEAGTAPEPKEN